MPEQDLDQRYEQFLARLSPGQRAEWARCCVLFAEKFGPELAAEGLRGGIDLMPEGESLTLADEAGAGPLPAARNNAAAG